MKPVIVIGVLLLATAVAIFLHARKMQAAPPAAKNATNGLEQLMTSLKPGQPISLYASDAPGETFLYVRLALAPRHVSLFNGAAPTDTVLYASRNAQLDEMVKAYVPIRRLTIGDVIYQLVIAP